MSLFMLGVSSNGVIIILIQIVVLSTMDPAKVAQASGIYTVTIIVILFICLLLFKNMLKYPIIDEKFNPKKTTAKKQKISALSVSLKAALEKKVKLKYAEIFART